MPRSSGVYTPPGSSWNPAVNGNQATAADWTALLADISAAMTQSVSADGQTGITGNIGMGGNKLTNLGNGTNAGDSVNFGQVFTNPTFNNPTLTGTVTVPVAVASTSPAQKAYVDASISASGAAPAWVSGTTYIVGATVYSPITFQTFRRRVAGAGTADPSLDSTNWANLGNVAGGGSQVTSGTNITLTSTSNRVQSINMTASGLSVTLPDATTLQTGGPVFILSATSASNTFTVRDSTGRALASVTAGASLICNVVANGTAAGVWAAEPLTAISQLVVGAQTVVAANASPSGCSVAMLTSTKAVFCYTTGTVGRVVVCDFSTGTPTFGTDLALASGANYVSVTALDSSKVIVAHDSLVTALSISGTTLTTGTGASIGSVTRGSITTLSATQALLCYLESPDAKVRVIDVSGLVCTPATSAVLNGTGGTPSSPAIAAVSSTRAAAFVAYGTGPMICSFVINVSGSTATPATYLSTGTAYSTSIMVAARVDATTVAHLWQTGASSWGVGISTVGASQVSPTISASQVSRAINSAALTMLNSTDLLVFWRGNGTPDFNGSLDIYRWVAGVSLTLNSSVPLTLSSSASTAPTGLASLSGVAPLLLPQASQFPNTRIIESTVAV